MNRAFWSPVSNQPGHPCGLSRGFCLSALIHFRRPTTQLLPAAHTSTRRRSTHAQNTATNGSRAVATLAPGGEALRRAERHYRRRTRRLDPGSRKNVERCIDKLRVLNRNFCAAVRLHRYRRRYAVLTLTNNYGDVQLTQRTGGCR